MTYQLTNWVRHNGPVTRRPCLKCRRTFDSHGARNRLCRRCAVENSHTKEELVWWLDNDVGKR